MSRCGSTQRDAILRRRARYVASALCSLCGCGQPAAPVVPSAPVAPQTGAPPTAPGPEATAAFDPLDWRAAFGPTPPLDVPPDLPADEQAQFAELVQEVRAIIAELDALESLLPRARGAFREGFGALCQGTLPWVRKVASP